MPRYPERRDESRVRLSGRVYASINPGLRAGRVENVSRSGMGILYITPFSGPQPIEELYVLINGFCHRLEADLFEVIYDSLIKGLGPNGRQLRRAGLRLTGECLEGVFLERAPQEDRDVAVIL